MSYARMVDYTDIPFCKEKPLDYYKYCNLIDLESLCNPNVEGIKVQCIGIIYSDNGIFYLKPLPQNKEEIKIKMSVVYLMDPPRFPGVPSTVQVFGELIWKRRPVIIVRMLHYLLPSKAVILHDVMGRIRKFHCATTT